MNFNKADVNSDGVLDESEFVKAIIDLKEALEQRKQLGRPTTGQQIINTIKFTYYKLLVLC